LEIIEHIDWWRVNKVFSQDDGARIQAYIRGHVLHNFAQGKRDEALKRTFITESSPFKYIFQELDIKLREYFNDYIPNTDRIRIELCADARGMWIDPHYDIPEKSFTMQVYLGHDTTDGTVFHFGNCYDFEVPWVGNCGYVIVRDKPVLHSLRKVKRQVRHSVLINYVNNLWTDTSQLLYG
jgi:hypothetical protein